MAIKLRTRLFLIVGALLAASILVSAVLSRQVTLVEVREFVTTRTSRDDGGARVLDAAAAAASRPDGSRLGSDLAALEEASGRRIVVFDRDGRIVQASNAALASARIRELTPNGTFVGTVAVAGAEAQMIVRGAPTRQVDTPDGPLWVLLLPPAEGEGPSTIATPRLPAWVWTTVATVIVAVPLVFAVSRRILGPVSELTRAAERMRAGELDVQVPARGDDELSVLARTFNDMAARLAETERLRRQMVSDIAHELRSPVTNLRCTLEAIQDGLASADGPGIEALYDETLFLQRLIADLEELTLADAGQLKVHRRETDLAALLQRVAGAIPASDRPVVNVEVGADLPSILADADRLEQVFRNLVSNARTHTPPDGRILVRAHREGESVRIDVADTGAGIAAAHLPFVFDRFYRADKSRSRTTGGAGLGLAIARQFVLAHGGSIEAVSDGPGKGATVTVRLPLSPP